jgi:hypothetical protein
MSLQHKKWEKTTSRRQYGIEKYFYSDSLTRPRNVKNKYVISRHQNNLYLLVSLKGKSSPFCASVLRITMWGPLMWTLPKFRMFRIFFNINPISYSFRIIANQNGVRYSDSTSYFKKYSSSKCKQTVCLHYGLDFPFNYIVIQWFISHVWKILKKYNVFITLFSMGNTLLYCFKAMLHGMIFNNDMQTATGFLKFLVTFALRFVVENYSWNIAFILGSFNCVINSESNLSVVYLLHCLAYFLFLL